MGVLVLVFLAIPVTVYTALQQQTSSTRASVETEAGVVAIINGEQIKKADVRKVAEEQYPPNAVDQVALQDAYEILKERKILDNAARNYALTPDQKRVTRFKNELNLSISLPSINHDKPVIGRTMASLIIKPIKPAITEVGNKDFLKIGIFLRITFPSKSNALKIKT